MYELLVGKPPFEMKNVKSTQKKIANFKGKGIKFPGHLSKDAEELIVEVSNLQRGRLGICYQKSADWTAIAIES